MAEDYIPSYAPAAKNYLAGVGLVHLLVCINNQLTRLNLSEEEYNLWVEHTADDGTCIIVNYPIARGRWQQKKYPVGDKKLMGAALTPSQQKVIQKCLRLR